jgi:thiamine monophosphate kinase
VAEVEAWLAGDRAPADVRVLAVRGGDDYELAIAVPPNRVEEMRAAMHPVALTRVGLFIDGSGVTVDGSAEAEFAALGWEHFRL